MRFITILLAVVGFCLLSHSHYGQLIQPMSEGGGTAPPTPSSTLTVSTNTCGDKTVTRSGTPPTGVVWYWQTSASGTDISNSTTTYTVSLQGTRTIYLRAHKPANGMWSTGTVSTSVTVNTYPATPSAPTVDNQCGQSVLTRGTPPSTPPGNTWYWQGTDSNGTSTANSATTYTVTASGTYYLRARSTAGCWSTSVGVSVTYRPIPATPADPTSSGNSCGPVTLSFNGSPTGNTVWYWQTSVSGTSTSLGSASTYVVSSSGTYYLRAYDTSSGCWSTGSGQVTVTVNPVPGAPAAPSVSNQCGSSTLTYSNGSGDTWYWQSTDANGTSTTNSSTTYSVTSSGTYYLRARNSAGCWSTSTGVAVTVLSKPSTPPTPSTSGNTCGPVTLTFNGTPPANVRWYWQTVSNGTSTTEGYASPKTVTTSGNYYLRAYNTNSLCWSDASAGPISVTYNPAVGSPSTTNVTREEPGIVNLSASLGTNGTGIRWYNASSGGTLLAEATTYSPVVSGTTTFYVSSFNSTTGCESARVAVTATVTPKPIISYTSLYIVMNNSITLSVANNTYSSYSWTRDGAAAGTTSSITTTQPGVYAVTVTKTGMTGSGTSVSVTVAVADMNSITVTNVKKEGVTSASSIAALAVNEQSKTTNYSGGLGNTIQIILSKVSPAQPAPKDIIVPVEYDVLGRQLKSYLPYVSSTDNSLYRGLALNNGGYTNSEQYLYYQNGTKIARDTKPYTITEVEPSPLGRALAQTGVGNDWHSNNKKVTQQYLLSRNTDGVRVWTLSGGLPVSSTTYADYQLFINLTTDENGNQVKSWFDKLGRIILKEVQAGASNWLQTYYIYDDKGRLAFTFLPEATRGGIFTTTPNQAFLDQWAFQYRYDERNRLVEYKAPAAGWVYTVYDGLNRAVMTQNADQRSRSEWAFVKYDVYGRPVVTGLKL